jgi:acetoin utilization deacetylase AcuC-like enzyme
MPKTLFKKRPTAAETLKNKILLCLQMIQDLDPNTMEADDELRALMDELNSYTQSRTYATLNTRLKERVEQVLNPTQPDPSQGYIQIPSSNDLASMQHMIAGADEDQFQRLTHMTEVVLQNNSLPVITTDHTALPDHWSQLFAIIKTGTINEAVDLLNQFPSEDLLFASLRAVHSEKYLIQLINSCIQARSKGFKSLNGDTAVTPETFEILIKDLATTCFSPSPLHFSFGLPSHHAYFAEGRGFCVINKTAVLMKYWELTKGPALKYVIVGTDVNRDDGLANISEEILSDMDICHIDIFDSRVYPHHNFSFISREFGTPAIENAQRIGFWKHNQLEYYAIDLSKTTRKKVSVHPALLFALSKIKDSIEEAKISGQKIALLLPTGWDSHEDETASCGKFITDSRFGNGRMMTQADARVSRFNDGDLTYFYEKLFHLYNENKELFAGFYWGLEGGYDRAMYERQIQLMSGIINSELLHTEANSSCSASSFP